MSGVEPAGYPKPRDHGVVAVRRIGRSEGRDAVHLLALAFVDEPALRYVLGGTPRRRLRVLIPFMWAGLRSYPRSVEIHGAWLDGKLAGAGLRMPPGAWPVGRWETLRGWAWGLLGALPMLVAFPQAVRVFRAAAEQQSHHPSDRPHWYLWTAARRRLGAGTLRHRAGRCRGSGLLPRDLWRWDRGPVSPARLRGERPLGGRTRSPAGPHDVARSSPPGPATRVVPSHRLGCLRHLHRHGGDDQTTPVLREGLAAWWHAHPHRHSPGAGAKPRTSGG
jgi:hypothetical protein